jgi:HD-GYP domain-containing protein (c-di-GMP phosphodiesterase class II)
MEETVQAIATTIEMRDPYTAGHQRRVAGLAQRIAARMHLSAEEIHGIFLAATIHDIGKIHIPAEILSFPGKLGEIEYTLIKTHVQAGYDILKNIEFPWPLAQMVYQHHEHLDGSGYPRGLQGDQISLAGRILCVADVVESMATYRPYRPGLGVRKALAEVRKNRGKLYDTAVVNVCLELFREGYEFG